MLLKNLEIMDCSKPKIRKKNPREQANILSVIFFIYAWNLFITGARKNLDLDDIYRVLKNHQASRLHYRMNKEWEKEKKKPNPSLGLIFLRMFGVEFALWGIGILVFVLCCHDIFESVLTGKLMTYFQPGLNVTTHEASLYASSVIGLMVTFILFDNTYLVAVWLIGLKMQIACCTMIYRKCLRLNVGLSTENNTGKAVTLITKDVMQLLIVPDCGHMLLTGFIRVIVTGYIMYRYVGISALIGVAFVLLMVPVNVGFGKLGALYRLKTAGSTDARVKAAQEIITAIRIIKMYTWEKFFTKKIETLRKLEIHDLRVVFYVKAIALSVGELSYRFAFYALIMTYIALGNHITAEKAFAVISCFGATREFLSMYLPLGISQMAEYRASLHRITNFLMLEEVSQSKSLNPCDNNKDKRICISNVTIKDQSSTLVLDNINLDITKGLTVIMGATGVGKSVILKMILGDIPVGNGEVVVCGNVSYASQEPWLFPSTVRQNIIFGEEYDEKRYKQVIEVCALEFDLQMFPNGDQTCLIDRGSNLSKGQKARINLARAVYRKADIYLLDDCLSSVDYSVGQYIFNKCIKEFLDESICILVTHNSLPLSPGDKIFMLNNGCLQLQKNLKQSITNDSLDKLQTEYEEINEEYRPNKVLESMWKPDTYSPDVYKEFNQTGEVKKDVYYQYFLSGGGWKIMTIVIFFFIAAYATTTCSDYFVSFWVDMEQKLSGFRLNQTGNSTEYEELEGTHDTVLKIYSIVMLGAAIFTIIRAYTFFFFTCKASTKVHNIVMRKIINTGIIFFDKNLSGNIINRLSRDLAMVDEYLPTVLSECCRTFLSILAVLFIVSSVNLIFIVPSLIFIALLYLARRWYQPTARDLRRLTGSARSPLIGHLSSTIEGLTTIRASRAEKILEREFDKHQDLFSSALQTSLATMKAFGFYTDIIGVIYISTITFSFIYFSSDTLAGKVGLAITQSFSLIGLLKWGVIQWSELENHMTSTERVLEYKNIGMETISGNKVEDWPNTATIEYQNVNLRYSIENERVLKNLNFYIGSKEKVGIVGRTGAGKSSIISTLFRMYDYEGVILVGGIDIKSVPINYLRSKISIIPQDPVLFSGTVRSNLDPYFLHSDKELWEALEEVDMKHVFKTLDYVIVDGGSDLSSGEKQLICLARAIIRNNTILVLDEATANLDPETDNLIQRTIEKRFNNCTVITIAHRLHTIMNSDKIIVMDAAKIIQLGPPKVLLEDRNGLFFSMVQQVGLQI